MRVLTPENANHRVSMSPDHRWFVDYHARNTGKKDMLMVNLSIKAL